MMMYFYAEYIWACNFETSDGAASFCNIEQDTRDQFEWLLWRGKTPSSTYERYTGPERAFNGEYYLYIEASRPRQTGNQAR